LKTIPPQPAAFQLQTLIRAVQADFEQGTTTTPNGHGCEATEHSAVRRTAVLSEQFTSI